MNDRMTPVLPEATEAIKPIRLSWRFVTNGGSDPTLMSPLLESVTRVTSDGGKLLYRVRLARAYRLDVAATAHSAPAVASPEGTYYTAHLQTGALVSAVPAEVAREFDIAVLDHTTVPAHTPTNSVPAGAVVTGSILIEWGAGG